MLQNAPNCTIQKFFRGSMTPNPPSRRMATPRIASPPPPKKKNKKNSWPPLANPACAHELHVLLRNLFEHPPWQIVDCHQCLSKLMGEQHYKRVSEKIRVYL